MSNTTPATGTEVPPTETVNTPATTGATPSGATYTQAQYDALRLKLEGERDEIARERDSAKVRITELNGESKGHRLRAQQLEKDLGDSGPELEKWRALGSLEDIDKRLKREAELSTKEQQREKREQLGQVAKVLGLKDNALFQKLADGVEFVPEQKDGATVGYKVKQGDKTEAFADWAQTSEEWRDALPALQAQAEAPSGRPHIRQVGGAGEVTGIDPNIARVEVRRRHGGMRM